MLVQCVCVCVCVCVCINGLSLPDGILCGSRFTEVVTQQSRDLTGAAISSRGARLICRSSPPPPLPCTSSDRRSREKGRRGNRGGSSLFDFLSVQEFGILGLKNQNIIKSQNISRNNYQCLGSYYFGAFCCYLESEQETGDRK